MAIIKRADLCFLDMGTYFRFLLSLLDCLYDRVTLSEKEFVDMCSKTSYIT